MAVSNPVPPHSGPKSNYMDDIIGLYRKAGDDGHSYDEVRKQGTKKKCSKPLVDVSQISIDGSNLGHGSGGGTTPVHVSSTPRANSNKRIDKKSDVDTANISEKMNISKSNSKKRSKSANSSLKENEVVKKAKTDEAPQKVKKKKKKNKHDLTLENNPTEDIVAEVSVETIRKKRNKSVNLSQENEEAIVKKVKTEDAPKLLKIKKKNKNLNTENNGTENTEISVEQLARENKKKKNKKKNKNLHTETNGMENKETNVEQLARENKKKKKKTNIKPVIQNLENLNIGHNAHTVTNLLDEMAVVDKTKKKKARKTANRIKKEANETTKEIKTTNDSKEQTDKIDIDTAENKEVKKWAKKRWGKKGSTSKHSTSVVVDNIPIALLFTYKPALNDMFKECGNVRTVGVAEVYPTEVSQPVFTTTIYFATPEAAAKALEKDGSKLKGSKIRVNPSLPLDKTTLVMRSYGPLTEQSVVTMFNGAGRIRSIRPVIKGKKTMSTVFVDFDGPDSVERALGRSANLTLKNKKIIVDKFKFTNMEHKQKITKESAKASDVESDSDD